LSSAARNRVLGIDAGERRVGVALSDELHLLATPLTVLDRRHGLRPILDSLLDLATRERVGHIVVGLPLNADGSEGAQARRARDFARAAERVLGLPVTLWDERLSSREAQAIVHAQGGRRRTAIDDVAAAVILQDYLDAQRRAAPC
jgi:putative Holliday junction resolvase